MSARPGARRGARRRAALFALLALAASACPLAAQSHDPLSWRDRQAARRAELRERRTLQLDSLRGRLGSVVLEDETVLERRAGDEVSADPYRPQPRPSRRHLPPLRGFAGPLGRTWGDPWRGFDFDVWLWGAPGLPYRFDHLDRFDRFDRFDDFDDFDRHRRGRKDLRGPLRGRDGYERPDFLDPYDDPDDLLLRGRGGPGYRPGPRFPDRRPGLDCALVRVRTFGAELRLEVSPWRMGATSPGSLARRLHEALLDGRPLRLEGLDGVIVVLPPHFRGADLDVRPCGRV